MLLCSNMPFLTIYDVISFTERSFQIRFEYPWQTSNIIHMKNTREVLHGSHVAWQEQ